MKIHLTLIKIKATIVKKIACDERRSLKDSRPLIISLAINVCIGFVHYQIGKPAPLRQNPPYCSGLRATNEKRHCGYLHQAKMNNLRARIKEKRKQLSDESLKLIGNDILKNIQESISFEDHQKISTYFSVNNEADTSELNNYLSVSYTHLTLPTKA